MQAYNINAWHIVSFSMTMEVLTYRHTNTVRLKALFLSKNASDVTMKYLLRANTTSRKDIQASIFNAR